MFFRKSTVLDDLTCRHQTVTQVVERDLGRKRERERDALKSERERNRE